MLNNKVHVPFLDIENIIPILSKIAIFGGLNDKQLFVVLRKLEKVSYLSGEYVFKQGEEPSHIYVVAKGEVKIVYDVDGQTMEIISFKEGDCFGETSVIGIQPHSTSAVAVQDTDLIVLPRKGLMAIFDEDKELFGLLILNIARETCRRLYKADKVLFECVGKKTGGSL